MIGNSVQKCMQCLPARLDEVIVKAFHHPLHYELFWQWLRKKKKKKVKTVPEYQVAKDCKKFCMFPC